MKKMDMSEEFPCSKVPTDTKVISATRLTNKKLNGTFRERVKARGFRLVAGKHYNSDSINSPVTNKATIRVVLVLLIIFRWTNEQVDIKVHSYLETFTTTKPSTLRCQIDLTSTTMEKCFCCC